MKTNKDLKSKWPWGGRVAWPDRTKAISEIVPPEASVIELGGGMCNLKKFIPQNKYVSIDVEEWTDVTIKADFNKGEFPETEKFDVVVCQGILEYIERPYDFLNMIHKYGRRLIISYHLGGNDVESRKNWMSFVELENLLNECGWLRLKERILNSREKIICCVKTE